MSTINPTRLIVDESAGVLIDEGIHRAQLAREALEAGDDRRAADELSSASVVLGVAATLLGEPSVTG